MLKVAPTLLMDKIEPSLNYWTEILGFKKQMEIPGKNGLAFVMLTNGAAEVHFQTRESLTDDLPYLATFGSPPATFLYIDVENVNELYEKLKGHDIVIPLEKTFYGATHFFLREPAGHVLGFSQNTNRETSGSLT